MRVNGTRRSWTSYVAAFASYLAVFGALQLATEDQFHDSDAPYHARFAAMWGREELSPAFRWAAESTWADRFADKEWLFHVYLAPFARAGEAAGQLASAIKLAIALAGALGVLAWFALLRSLAVPSAYAWTLVVLGSGAPWLHRMGMVRPHVVGVGLFAALCLCLAARRARAAAAIACVFALAYTAFHAALCAAALVCAVWWAAGRASGVRVALAVAGGVAVGCVAHPEFPLSLETWYAQHVELVISARLSPPSPRFARSIGQEFDPMTLGTVYTYLLPLVAVWLAIAGAALSRRVRPSDEALAMTAVAAAFGGLCAVSTRFIEHFAPLTVLAAALWHRDALRAGGPDGWLVTVGRHPRMRAAVAVAIFGMVVGSVVPAAAAFRRRVARGPDYASAARWLANHTPRNAKVFHASFSDFPGLWYENQHNSYLVAMDPVFFLARSRERCELWLEIAAGRNGDPVAGIRDTLGCGWAIVVAVPRYERLIAMLDADSRARRVDLGGEADARVVLFELAGG